MNSIMRYIFHTFRCWRSFMKQSIWLPRQQPIIKHRISFACELNCFFIPFFLLLLFTSSNCIFLEINRFLLFLSAFFHSLLYLWADPRSFLSFFQKLLNLCSSVYVWSGLFRFSGSGSRDLLEQPLRFFFHSSIMTYHLQAHYFSWQGGACTI